MTQIARANGIKVMFATFTFRTDLHGSPPKLYVRGVLEHNVVLRDLAKRMDVPLLPFDELMPKNPDHWADGIHNTAEGAAVKAGIFAKFIDEHFLAGHEQPNAKENTDPPGTNR